MPNYRLSFRNVINIEPYVIKPMLIKLIYTVPLYLLGITCFGVI